MMTSVGTRYAPAAAIRFTVASSRMLPCSIDRTPAESALFTASEVWQCAITYVPKARASSTAAVISAMLNCTLSIGSFGDMMPPDAINFT